MTGRLWLESRKPQRGLSLVELLIALLLGVLLSSGVVAAYLGGKRHFLYAEQMARMQENGRYALGLISRDLAMAGFFGGLPDASLVAAQAVTGDCAAGDWALSTSQPLGLVDNHSGVLAPLGGDGHVYTCIDGGTVQAGTDLLAIKRSFSEPSLQRGEVAASLTRGAVELWYLRRQEGAVPRWVQHRSRDLEGLAVANPTLSFWEASARVFFIRRFAVEPADGVPTLCVDTLAGNAMTVRCLVEGVEDLQFEFGIDTDGDGVANLYRDSLSAEDASRAVTAAVHVLLRSLNPLPGHIDNRSYRLGRRQVDPPGDGYLRSVYSTLVSLNNLVAARAWHDV
ncbi:MAG: PilW family protein [Halioglobus sp.]|nr:PilW family protein [Halioglobus sp.]